MAAATWSILCLVSLTTVVLGVSDKDQTQIVEKLWYLYQKNSTFASEFDKQFLQEPPQVKANFPCSILSPSPSVPTSVHSLKPGDIKVIGAIGDSLTAGRGAAGGLFGLLLDYRGLSWSIGGDDSFSELPTLPNILRQYNPSLYGFSQGTGNSKALFNVAETGAKSNEALSQAKELVARMKDDVNVDFANDWKLITIFIGANDLCDYCKNKEEFSVDKYTRNLQETLDYLSQSLPRTFVNLVEVLNVEMAQDLGKNFVCDTIHAFTCDCAANPENAEAAEELHKLRIGYQQVAHDLVASGSYDISDEFTVVLQPFYHETSVPTTSSGEADFSFFASDCFHYSRKGQEATAEALWNNMVEPVGSKRLSWTPGEPLECLTEESPYLFTNRNSNRKAQKSSV